MNKKTLTIILLVLLLVVVLFVVSLSLGARKPGSGMKLDLNSPDLVGIASWLSRPVKAENLTLRSDKNAGCSFVNGQITIQPNMECVFSVSSDKIWTRKLRLMLLPLKDGLLKNVTVLLEQPEALTVGPLTLKPGKTSEPLDIYGRKDQEVAVLKIKAPPAADLDLTVYVIEVIEK